MKPILFIAAGLSMLLVYALPVSAQSKFHAHLDYHYSLGWSETGYNGQTLYRNDWKMHGNSLRLSALYTFAPAWEAGLGMGADRYEEPGYNTFPLFAVLHCAPLKKHRPLYSYTDIGYALKTGNSTPGLTWNIGFGYKLMLKKHFGFNFQFGYNLKQFKNDYLPSENGKHFQRNSLSFGAGIIL